MLQYDDAPELSTGFPRFIGDNESWHHAPEGELGTEYAAYLSELELTLPRQDDDPKACPF